MGVAAVQSARELVVNAALLAPGYLLFCMFRGVEAEERGYWKWGVIGESWEHRDDGSVSWGPGARAYWSTSGGDE